MGLSILFWMSGEDQNQQVRSSGFVPRPICYRHPKTAEEKKSARLSALVIGVMLIIGGVINFGYPAWQIVASQLHDFNGRRNADPELVAQRMKDLGLDRIPSRLRPQYATDFRVQDVTSETVQFSCLTASQAVIVDCIVYVSEKKNKKTKDSIGQLWFKRFPEELSTSFPLFSGDTQKRLWRKVWYPEQGGKFFAYYVQIDEARSVYGIWPAKRFSRETFTQLVVSLLPKTQVAGE